MEALPFALQEPFHQKDEHDNNQQPRVFRGFEDEAHDQADEGGQKGCCFLADLLQPFLHTFAQCFQGVCYRPFNGTNDSRDCNNYSSGSETIFSENLFYAFT